ncbi:MAG TPA: hypothetical protein VFJ82_06665 [Longimicrobium sp.]|nr:hypothetical protein [Longimicrobium sp.]
MKKLAMNVDELKVDSFEIAPRGDGGGTVQANWAWSDDSVCPTTNPSDRRPCV